MVNATRGALLGGTFFSGSKPHMLSKPRDLASCNTQVLPIRRRLLFGCGTLYKCDSGEKLHPNTKYVIYTNRNEYIPSH